MLGVKHESLGGNSMFLVVGGLRSSSDFTLRGLQTEQLEPFNLNPIVPISSSHRPTSHIISLSNAQIALCLLKALDYLICKFQSVRSKENLNPLCCLSSVTSLQICNPCASFFIPFKVHILLTFYPRVISALFFSFVATLWFFYQQIE